jgi:ribosomal-protein-alanine N-acetyltransferase
LYSLTTERLRLTPLADGDAPFILELLNDPDFLRLIGDRGVRDLDGACSYIATGPQEMYSKHGIGLLRVGLLEGTAIGICGLLQRDYLPDPDLGFALLSGFRGQGYATEASRAVLNHAHQVLGHSSILAITHPQNDISAALLGKLGFERQEVTERNGESISQFKLEYIIPG